VAKAAKAAEEAEVAAVNGRQEGERSLELEAQMQRLSISNLLQCRHGHGMLASSSHDQRLCTEIMNSIKFGWRTHFEAGNDDFMSCFNAGIDAAREKYAAVFDDIARMEMLASHCVAIGSKAVLDGDDKDAQHYASFACHFEQYNLVRLKKTQFEVNWIQVLELHQCDDMHSLVKYLRKRIPCSCLDQKCKEVKSLPRFGLCCNPDCTLPHGQVERSKMFSCTGCDEMNYCSHQCQKTDWPRHKEWCKRRRGGES
jgi:hypothetical protein